MEFFGHIAMVIVVVLRNALLKGLELVRPEHLFSKVQWSLLEVHRREGSFFSGELPEGDTLWIHLPIRSKPQVKVQRSEVQDRLLWIPEGQEIFSMKSNYDSLPRPIMKSYGS